jgi:hypothetical protein
MTEQRKADAEARLAAAFAEHDLSDGRPAYRKQLRALRETDPSGFEEALRHYEDVVVPALCDEPDALSTWIRYGAWLGDRTGDGRLVAIDKTGRAGTYRSPYMAGTLVLRVPANPGDPVIPAAVPGTPSQAQQATMWLLVEKRLALI